MNVDGLLSETGYCTNKENLLVAGVEYELSREKLVVVLEYESYEGNMT